MRTQFSSGLREADDDSFKEYRVEEDSWAEGDDDSYSAEGDDDREGDDDSAEGLFDFVKSGISGALDTVNRIVSPTLNGKSVLNIPLPNPIAPFTGGLSAISNLVGKIASPSGKQIDFKLPQNTATKDDIAVLKQAVDANSKAIRTNTSAIKKEAEAIVNVRKTLREVDVKHNRATKKQNSIMGAINTRVTRLRKDLDKTRQEAQTQQMFSLLMQPKLSSITFTNAPAPGVATPVTASKFDDSNLFLMLALSGGLGGGDSNNNNSLLPLLFLSK